MDFNTVLRKMNEDQAADQAAEKKAAALAALKAKNQLKDGDDIMPDPTDPSGNKWKIIPAAMKQQANSATVSR
jgi:hypothetical protein